MSDLVLGHFQDFKGSDTILLSCSRIGVERLLRELGAAEASPVALHLICQVTPKHPTTLFAAGKPVAGNVTWVVPTSELPGVSEMLQSLARTDQGHQFFDLQGSSATLVVSLNEYNEEWWRAHA